MTGWRSGGRGSIVGRLLLTAAALTLSSGAPAVADRVAGAPAAARDSGQRVEHSVLFRFADRAVAESSGAVDAGAVLYTVNDSGSGPVLYAVDTTTGRTVATTTYSAGEVRDVEALAPAAGGSGDVWVADIGDNLRSRDHVSLYRVRPGGGAAPRVDLVYPEGPRDAETLLVHPGSGRVFVVSKTVFGGTVYEAGSTAPGATHRLRPFAQVPGLVTDGAFFPDGRHVLLRGYGTASVYTFPDFSRVATLTLPTQRQGEAVAIGSDGRILLTSEGPHTPVLAIELPRAVARVVADGPETGAASPGDGSVSALPSPSTSPPSLRGSSAPAPTGDSASVPGDDLAGDDGVASGPAPWSVAAGALVLVALAVLVLKARRRP